MFTFLIISAVVALCAHKFVMKSVNDYEYYGSTARQEWVNFERERLGH